MHVVASRGSQRNNSNNKVRDGTKTRRLQTIEMVRSTRVVPAGNGTTPGTEIGLGGTHLVRILLLTPWVCYVLSPFALRTMQIHPAMYSAPVRMVSTNEWATVYLAFATCGLVAVFMSLALEAGRRCKLPVPKHANSSAPHSTGLMAGLRGCSQWRLDARSMLVWDTFDWVETIIISSCLVGGATGDAILREESGEGDGGLQGLPGRVAQMVVLPFVVMAIVKRVNSSIARVQREHTPAFVSGTVVPVMAKALCFQFFLMLVYTNAGLSYPYHPAIQEHHMAFMLVVGNNSRVQCDDEAAFWDSFKLPFTYEDPSGLTETFECRDPLCGYRSWTALCQAWRFSFVSKSTGWGFWSIQLGIPILLFIALALAGSGRIERTVDGEIDLKRLLAPHIVLILALATAYALIVLDLLSNFVLQAPLLMLGMPLADPLAGCGPDSFCWFFIKTDVGMYMGCAACALLPLDTLKRVLKRYGNRHRTYFLSYKQDDGNDGAVQMLATLLGTGSVWLDKLVDDRSETGMVNGVTSQDVFVAILSQNYFKSKFCCLEMHTALKMGKPVLIVWNQSKSTVQTALRWVQELPQPELAILLENELLPIQEDIQMAGTCAARITAASVKPQQPLSLNKIGEHSFEAKVES